MPLQIRRSEICSLQSGNYSITLRLYAISGEPPPPVSRQSSCARQHFLRVPCLFEAIML